MRTEPLQPVASSSLALVRELWLRLLGLVFLIAFLSLWIQLDGLVGSRGILPVDDYLERVAAVAEHPYRQAPTLLWLSPGDRALDALAVGGVAFSLLLLLGVATAPVVLVLWALYLSLTVGGQVFLSFQWDTLLLESALCALVLAPMTWRPGKLRSTPSPRPGIWLLRLLLFKLMFLSGVVKPLSLDPAWLELTALEVHYFTQPLPLATSWYAHQLPTAFQQLSVLLTYAVEIAIPFAIFGPRRLRLIACAALVALQALIAATGNYGFFNLLTMVLCLSLLDDSALLRLAPTRLRRRLEPTRSSERQTAPSPGTGLRWAVVVLVALLNVPICVREMTRTLPTHRLSESELRLVHSLERALVEPVSGVLGFLAPFRSLNGYGLFRSMTTARPEIAVEWSDDGEQWHEYAFRWKPGATERRPRLAAPHMPRLDWQMWFAALNPRGAGWLGGFARSLLEGEPEVLRLLAREERPPRAPRYVRLQLWDYRFTTPEERAKNGDWWHREPIAQLSSALTLEDLARSP